MVPAIKKKDFGNAANVGLASQKTIKSDKSASFDKQITIKKQNSQFSSQKSIRHQKPIRKSIGKQLDAIASASDTSELLDSEDESKDTIKKPAGGTKLGFGRGMTLKKQKNQDLDTQINLKIGAQELKDGKCPNCDTQILVKQAVPGKIVKQVFKSEKVLVSHFEKLVRGR